MDQISKPTDFFGGKRRIQSPIPKVKESIQIEGIFEVTMHTKVSSSVALPSLAMQEETKIDEGIQADENDDGGGDAASSASITAAAVVRPEHIKPHFVPPKGDERKKR